VTDRPGHDRRYAIDARKLERELGWKPAETFDTGIRKTVQWYLANGEWVHNVQSGAYREWVEKQYARRRHRQARGMKICCSARAGRSAGNCSAAWRRWVSWSRSISTAPTSTATSADPSSWPRRC
jgi:hypothetical protein